MSRPAICIQGHSTNEAAIILFFNKWDEILREKGKDQAQPYIVPDHGVISIRFPQAYIGKQVRIFVESIEETG